MSYRLYIDHGSLIFQAHDTYYILSRVQVRPGFWGFLVAVILVIVWWYCRRKT